MKPVDQSPLLLFGPRSLLFIGELELGSWHAHAATVCVVGLDKNLGVLAADEGATWQHARAAVIPAGFRHRLDPGGGRCAVIYSEVYAPVWQAMEPARDADGAGISFPAHETLQVALLDAFEGPIDQTVLARLKHCLDETLGLPQQSPPRVLPAVQTMMRCVAEERECSLEDLAEEMQLSASRVQRLFLEELGVGYKKLQLWLRFRAAMLEGAEGGSVTNAALASGFASSSHFSHAFRSMFGVSLRHAGILAGSFRFEAVDW